MADYNAIKKQTDAQAQKAIAKYNEIRDKEVLNTEKIYNEEIAESDASYEKVYDQANVNRIVNEKFAAEAAANMGLAKSGYNRNRQTQIKLAYGNAVLETDLQKTAAANNIRQQLAQYKAGVESEKSQYALTTQQSFDQLAQQSYNTQYAAEKEAAAKITAARISAANSHNSKLASIAEKCAEFEDEDSLVKYLDGLEMSGVISPEENEKLYNYYKEGLPGSYSIDEMKEKSKYGWRPYFTGH